MSVLSSVEQQGIRDLLVHHGEQNLAFDLARVVCKNMVKPASFEEAVDLVLLHSSSVHSILNRKAITKGTIFRYLHDQRVPIKEEPSKNDLIEKLLSHWHQTHRADDRRLQCNDEDDDNDDNKATTAAPINCPAEANTTVMRPHDGNHTIAVDANDLPENFPIHRMSRLFTGWFFAQFNTGQLSADDFWSDAHCDIESHGNCESADGDQACAAVLLALRDRHEFYLNPNESHSGCQGRVDAHGLVLVLGCGTLHARQQFVGCWECAFGLVRDPFTDNNWKVRHMRLRLRSSAPPAAASALASTLANGADELSAVVPRLVDCAMLQDMLALPASGMDLE